MHNVIFNGICDFVDTIVHQFSIIKQYYSAKLKK